MKIYQVSYRGRGILNGEHLGFEYVSSRRKAERLLRENTSDSKGPDDYCSPITEFNVTLDKAGILQALNRYGSHPDNG